MHITHYGHSAFLLELNGGTLLVDPFLSDNPLAKDCIDIKKIKCDAILVTHGHWDHTGDALAIAKQNGVPIIANVEVAKWFEKQGAQTRDMNFGGQLDLGFARVRLVPAVHSSALPDGSYGGNPGGFVITHDDGVIYISGDTALTSDMALIGRRYKPDLALLCMGDVYTMGVDDAVEAAKMLNVTRVIGMHYDTWPPIAIDHDKAVAAFAAAQVDLTLLPLFEKIKVEKFIDI